jgi:enoyl-CoA hydratase/carnithine racemase
MTMYETLLVEITDGVAVVTINRPHVRNAIAPPVQDDVRRFLAAARVDDAVRAVVFTGAGDRAFVAGADLGALRHYTPQTALDGRLQGLLDEIEAFPKPTIAAVNGYALGGGCELAMACDIRIAADTAELGLPEVGLSILPGAGGTQRLSRLVGVGRAIDLVLTGRRITAQEALQMGLVTQVVPHHQLLAAATDLAHQVLAKGPLAVRLAKLVIRAGLDADQGTGQVVERLAQALLYGSDDKREGVESFLAKRAPEYSGG